MTTKITFESDFYFWIVEYLHKLGPMKMEAPAYSSKTGASVEVGPTSTPRGLL